MAKEKEGQEVKGERKGLRSYLKTGKNKGRKGKD